MCRFHGLIPVVQIKISGCGYTVYDVSVPSICYCVRDRDIGHCGLETLSQKEGQSTFAFKSKNADRHDRYICFFLILSDSYCGFSKLLGLAFLDTAPVKWTNFAKREFRDTGFSLGMVKGMIELNVAQVVGGDCSYLYP